MKQYISGATHYFNSAGCKLIQEAIALTSTNSGAIIHVHIDKSCDISTLDRAAEVFNLLNLNRTKAASAVLIYLSIREKQFAIIGDGAINNRVPETFWKEVVENMTIYFKSGDFIKGIIDGIESAGKKLQAFFPITSTDAKI